MQRHAILLYGSICYLLFLATFVYAMAFVGNLWVPRSIDVGVPAQGPWDWVVNCLLLGLFAVQHTIMARPWFKAAWTRIIPRAAERSTFVLATVICFGLLFWFWRPIPGVVWSLDSQVLQGVTWGLFALGFAIVLVSTFLIDHFELFGLRQVVDHFRGAPHRRHAFVTRGLYRVVRHPLMLGFLIAFWATPEMTVGHLLFAVMVTGYILVGVMIEERDLVAAHPQEYRAYRRTTPSLIPFTKGLFGGRHAGGTGASHLGEPAH